MEIKIECKIKNVNAGSGKALIIRKFFQILFFDPECVTIYTATVLGDKSSEEGFIGQVPSDFAVDFEYSAQEEEEKLQITLKDETEFFLDGEKHIKAVWGEKCEIIGDYATKVTKLEKIFNGVPKEQVPSELIAVFEGAVEEQVPCLRGDSRFLYVEEDKGETELNRLLKTLACQGLSSTKDEGESKTVTIKRLNLELCTGVEVVNWIKTKIKFKKNIDPDTLEINYSITFAKNSLEHGVYAPDFTVYFAPPRNCIVNIDDAKVNFKPDLIAPVARREACYFSEWRTKHQILDRKMSRLVTEKLPSYDRKGKLSVATPKIEMLFGIVNRNFLVNAHFVLGILLSALVALGFTLATNVKGFAFVDHFAPNVQWFVSYVLIFFTIFISSLRATYTPEGWWIKGTKQIGIILFGVWLVCICALSGIPSIVAIFYEFRGISVPEWTTSEPTCWLHPWLLYLVKIFIYCSWLCCLIYISSAIWKNHLLRPILKKMNW